MLDTELMQSLHYDPEDLGKNRNGHLSHKQASQLRGVRLRSIVLPALLAFVTLQFAIFYVRIPRKVTGDYLTLGFVAVLALVFAYMGVTRWMRLSEDIRLQRVKRAHGKVSLGGAETRNMGYQDLGIRLKINNTDFILPRTARKAFAEGKPYNIYYLPNSRIVVSAERASH